jgi:hypothetical protein
VLAIFRWVFGGAVGPLIQAHASELFNHYSTEEGDAPYRRNQSLPVILANLAALAAVLSLIKFNRQAASAGGGVYIMGSLIVSHPGAGHTEDDEGSSKSVVGALASVGCPA